MLKNDSILSASECNTSKNTVKKNSLAAREESANREPFEDENIQKVNTGPRDTLTLKRERLASVRITGL
ncbi:MAG: hypothetical protein AAFO59_07930, partial [Cyanobacteria bacterium J06607_17]